MVNLTKITLFIKNTRQQSIWAGGVPMHYTNAGSYIKKREKIQKNAKNSSQKKT